MAFVGAMVKRLWTCSNVPAPQPVTKPERAYSARTPKRLVPRLRGQAIAARRVDPTML